MTDMMQKLAWYRAWFCGFWLYENRHILQ